jgi:hypothetical protein
MGRNEKPVVVGYDDLRDVAEILKHFSDRYEALAMSLHATHEINSLTVRNWETMKTSLGHIQRAVNRAYEAFDEAKIMNTKLGKRTDSLVAESTDADAAASHKKKPRAPKPNETK